MGLGMGLDLEVDEFVVDLDGIWFNWGRFRFVVVLVLV